VVPHGVGAELDAHAHGGTDTTGSHSESAAEGRPQSGGARFGSALRPPQRHFDFSSRDIKVSSQLY